jgi:signal transduction histidine kinase
VSADDEIILEVFRSIHPQELPIGFYLVTPEGRFLILSPAVRHMLGIPADCDPGLIGDYYENPAQRKQLLEEALQLSKQGNYLQGALIRFRTPSGICEAENTCRALIHPQTGQVIGYYGTLIDRTAEAQSKVLEHHLQHQIEELSTDIGRVLHTNSSTLRMVRLTLEPVLTLLYNELDLPQQGLEITADRQHALLETQVQKLVRAIQDLLNNPQERRQQVLPLLRWEYLQQCLEDLHKYAQIAQLPESRPGFLRKISDELQKILSELRPGLAREQIRATQRALLDLQRAINIISVSATLIAVVQMEHTVHSLNEYINVGQRAEEERILIPLRQLVDNALTSLTSFAETRGIEIHIEDYTHGIKVHVSQRDIQRALANLIHNAIKYSWSRSNVIKPPWITIELRASEREVTFRIENWGVPIPRDEIEEQLIFQLGYRGRLSKDRNRLGTGTGLTDVLNTVQAHAGRIEVSSVPASSTAIRDENHPDYYHQAFLTNFIIHLPRPQPYR